MANDNSINCHILLRSIIEQNGIHTDWFTLSEYATMDDHNLFYIRRDAVNSSEYARIKKESKLLRDRRSQLAYLLILCNFKYDTKEDNDIKNFKILESICRNNNISSDDILVYFKEDHLVNWMNNYLESKISTQKYLPSGFTLYFYTPKKEIKSILKLLIPDLIN